MRHWLGKRTGTGREMAPLAVTGWQGGGHGSNQRPRLGEGLGAFRWFIDPCKGFCLGIHDLNQGVSSGLPVLGLLEVRCGQTLPRGSREAEPVDNCCRRLPGGGAGCRAGGAEEDRR